MAPFNKDNYNKAYEIFVGDGKNIVGLIAYSRYKNDKREQIVNIKDSKNREPNKTELKEIERFCLSRRANYMRDANAELDELVNGLIIKNKDQVFQKHFSEQYQHTQELEKIAAEIKTIKANTIPKSYWGEIFIELSGNFFWLVFLIAISIVTYFTSDTVRSLKDGAIKLLQHGTELPKSDTTNTKH